MKMKDHYMNTFGDIFGESEAAPDVFRHGWNAALDEAARQIEQMKSLGDTATSFSVFVKNLKEPEK